MADTPEEPKISKRAAEKEAKKAAAKAKKDAAKASNASDNSSKPAANANASTTAAPVDQFKTGWLKGVYNEKPVEVVQTRFPPEVYPSAHILIRSKHVLTPIWPNGYLHIGHAKAITVNFGFAKSYGGKCNLRFDDTNPSSEEEQFFTSIEDMVRWLGFTPAKITYSSDDFDQLYELAEKLITRGKAYVCHCTKDAVQKGRGGKKGELPRSVCANWGKSVEKNLEEFRGMRDGKYEPGTAHLRMKQFLGVTAEQYTIDKENDSPETKKEKLKLKSLAENPAFWDVAAYRIKQWKKDESKPDQLPPNHHHRTGDKWKIYPTYEFTHCLVDAFEGITHSLCTVEFETLRPAYNWLLEALDYKLPDSEEKGPMQREYGRLNVEGTILSKRRIAMLVNGWSAAEKSADPADEAAEGVEVLQIEDSTESPAPPPPSNTTPRSNPPVVRNWDDPRLFTLVALRRRGVPPGALKKFVLDLGVTKANANTMTHNLDASIRTYLERTVPRLMLVLDPIKVVLQNLPDDHLEEREVPFDPKDPAKGIHKVPFTKVIYIERDDFREEDDPDFFRLAPGKSVGLLNAQHPVRCISFTKDPSTGKVDTITAEYGEHVPGGKARIHWVGESAKHNSPIKAECRLFNPLFKTAKPNELDWKEGGYFENVNPESEIVFKGALVECGLREVQKRAPWPMVEGETAGERSSVRFQGLRTAYFAEDTESTEEKVVLNRIVTLKEDGGKKG